MFLCTVGVEELSADIADSLAIGAMRALKDAGLRVPEDISVAGYDGIHLAKVMNLTTYSQNAEKLGSTAAEQLISLIERPKTTLIDRILVNGELLEGGTVRDIR